MERSRGGRYRACLLLAPQLSSSMRYSPTPQSRATGVIPTQYTPERGRTCDSNKLQSTHTPFPVFSLEIQAAIIAPWAYKPVAMSVLATPTYSTVTTCYLLIVMIEANLARRAIGFTSATLKISISWLVAESVVSCHYYMCISPAGEIG